MDGQGYATIFLSRPLGLKPQLKPFLSLSGKHPERILFERSSLFLEIT